MISLSKITFNNFKVFGGKPYTIVFEDNRLVLLDGPNGYGKTSVFDAIELGVTGNIDRLISLESRQYPADVVVAHQGAGSVDIILEFKDANSNVKIFQRKLKDKIPNNAKKISKFSELWELNEIVDGVSLSSDQHKLNEHFGCKDFARDFLLFHYVQQEETSRFLKTKNETQRAEELSQLFGNTREADEKLTKLIEIHKEITTNKKKVKARTEEINRLYNPDQDIFISAGDDELHDYCLPWLAEVNKSPFWDEPKITGLSHERLNSSLEEIGHIKDFLQYQSFFFRSRRFDSAIHQREILELYVGYSNFIDYYDFYARRSVEYEKIKSSHLVLASGDLKKIVNINIFGDVFQLLGLGSSLDFESALQSLVEEEKKTSGLNSIYSELIKHHDSISEGLKKIPSEASCLLCGQDYESHDALSHAIAKHGHLLRSELSEQDKILVTTRDTFNNSHLIPLADACAAYLEKTLAPAQEDLLYLSKALKMKDRFEKLQLWLKFENIEYEDLLATSFPSEGGRHNISVATDSLCERIRSAIGEAPDGYYEANGSNTFDRIYRDYFKSKYDKLDLVSIDQLDKKESYIKNLYFSSLLEVSEELVKLSRKSELLERAEGDVFKLIQIVKSKIKQYRKKLITDIEIPFYIYSGKILQSHQAGLGHGIFIKDPTGDDELKNVRLVSNWESDHDILNTMSSGQISAVVIALTLALHKVYANRFSSILIDDPVQTMDDINMSSLVEVLRNDFCENQIILSTHEDKVARYFTYKYLKHGENVKIINLMQRKEYVPSNKFLYRMSHSEVK
ncbi:ATP-binding protein [Vreelandella janggokensis]|uniref:ATP-binding protein n=1 Tax=Vreelandella janggokensis TaxID=370767 RepID=UPI0028614FAD|nr:ATP-binding protein [Halomonas janggokensis]MDR5886299.1 ATP-binding protein [Halomonas janggokensis]